VVHDVLNLQRRPLVDGVAKGDASIVALSGLDSSAHPTAHTAPDAPILPRIADGSTPSTAKVAIARSKKLSLAPAKPATSEHGLFYT
jgi:hypothetical protein